MNPLNKRKARRPRTMGDWLGSSVRHPRLDEKRKDRGHHSGFVKTMLARHDVIHLFAERLHALDGKGDMRDGHANEIEGPCFGRLHALDGKGHRDQTLEEAHRRLDALERGA